MIMAKIHTGILDTKLSDLYVKVWKVTKTKENNTVLIPTTIHEEIILCLAFFSMVSLKEIKKRLSQRGINFSSEQLQNSLDKIEKLGTIKKVQMFENIYYKLDR